MFGLRLKNWRILFYKYKGEEIPRGRAFGSKGGAMAADMLRNEMRDNLSLENTAHETIQAIDNTYYNRILNVTDFQLQVYSNTYPYSPFVPKNESFAFPAGHLLVMNDYSFDNVTVKSIDMKEKKTIDIIKEFYDFDYSVIHNNCVINKDLNFAGEAVYLNDTASLPDPTSQCGIVYFLNETAGINETLENLTSSEGCVIIDNASLGGGAINKTVLSVANVSFSTGPQIMDLLLLHNDSIACIDDGVLTLMYNFSCKLLTGYALIDQMPNYSGIREWLDNRYKRPEERWPQARFGAYWKHICKVIDILGILPRFRALVLYESYDQHLMGDAGYKWNPRLGDSKYKVMTNRVPIFSVNLSVGEEINMNIQNTKLTGRVHRSVDDVTAKNVLGNLTIPQSPQDKIAVISNRYDGWWGQTPGDSGFGAGIVLGIAKHLKELRDQHNILPKYNTTFLFTTGEEYGLRGARYYSDIHQRKTVLHEGYNISYWLVLDQLAFNQTHVITEASVSRPRSVNALDAIITESNFEARTGYPFEPASKALAGTEQKVYADAFDRWFSPADIVCIADDKHYEWDFYHRTGSQYTKGDAMGSLDQNKGNVTAELAWNITKYFLLNPDCWFDGPVSYSRVDTSNDGDTEYDSIEASFTVKTALPSDKVRVRAMMNGPNNVTRFWKDFDFWASSQGTQKTITVTLPPTFLVKNDYHLYLQLFNSTGRIDLLATGSGMCNDSDFQSGGLEIYPRGNSVPNKPSDIQGNQSLQVFEEGTFNASAVDGNGDQLEFHWDWGLETDDIGPIDSGQLCEAKHNYHRKGTKVIRVKVREDYLGQLYDGGPLMNLYRYGSYSSWSNPFNVTVEALINIDVACTSAAAARSATQNTAVQSVLNMDSIFTGTAFGGTAPYNYTWYFQYHLGIPSSYKQTVSYQYNQTGIKSMTLNITDSDGYSKQITANVTVVNLSASYNISLPSLYALPGETIVFNDTSGVRSDRAIANWTWDFGDGTVLYSQNASHSFDYLGTYTVTLTVRDSQNETGNCSQQLFIGYDDHPPEIETAHHSPEVGGFGANVSIVAIVSDGASGVKSVHVNVTSPDNATANLTMTHVVNQTYQCFFTYTWTQGVFHYCIWAQDYENNTNSMDGFNFTIAANATISVCTVKDTFGPNEYINLTDPPAPAEQPIGYELLDGGAVLHLWNRFDSYYFDTDSGIQLTNHKDNYWSRNVLMLGYYSGDQWNLIYRTDELSGFSRSIDSDGASFVNVTLWKDLTYGGHPFRLAVRYHLGVDDNDLTVVPAIKNTGTSAIPYALGFGWELKDIQVDMTPAGDYIVVGQEQYFLNQSLDNAYTDLDDAVFHLMDDVDGGQQFLYLRWDPDLTYKLLVKSRTGQQNAPVTLFIRVGTLAAGQQKATQLQWYDASQQTFSFDSYDGNEAWEGSPEYMVDGLTDSFAYTNTDGANQLLDGITCSGGNGTILKVELRAHCYLEGEGANITLRPQLEQTAGQNYTAAAPEGEAAWTSWFDITSDLGHGSGGFSTAWTWEEVRSLDCRVIASLAEGTLHCSMVELRVTYNTAPTLSDPSPAHGSDNVSLQPTLCIAAADPDGDLMNLTWYSNSTASTLTLRPNAAGAATELSKETGGPDSHNYQCVDEAVANDLDYVYWQGSSWKKDLYGLPDHGNASGTIHDVTVVARCRTVAGGLGFPVVNCSGKVLLRTNGTVYEGTQFAVPSAYSLAQHTWTTNPATGAAWNWTAVDGLQAGIAFIGNAASSRCSQLYVVVNCTDPSVWTAFGTNASVGNGTYRQPFQNATVNGQWWWWKVKAQDGNATTWSSAYKFYTGVQSKIENVGQTNISGYLLMQVQFYNTTSCSWEVAHDTINETAPRTIAAGEALALDKVFNGNVTTGNLTAFGNGTYRIYAAFRDPEGNVLICSNDALLAAAYEFSVEGL